MNSINKVKISALIVARNEENHIKECLQSLDTIDEIVLFLDRTSDQQSIINTYFDCIIIDIAVYILVYKCLAKY